VFKKKSFDFIYCSGVLHHTSAPKEGFKQLVSLLKDDGCIVIGLYNFYGRFWTKLKAIIFKLNIFKKNAFLLDDKLKEFKRGSKKYNSWFNDQFNHPLESVHTFDEVLLWFKECNIELIFSLPSTTFFDEINFNSRQDKSNFIIRTFKQIFMLFNIWGKEGGLFIFVGKKNVRN
jgi:SAM-dependent methyltransferase